MRPFIHQFMKYWGNGQQVLVAGFTSPEFSMPKNFRFHSIGKMRDYPLNKWSDSIIDLLNYVVDDVFVFMLEDYWITDHVDKEGVQLLVDYARSNPDIVRIDLTIDRYNTMKFHPEFAGKYDYEGGKLGHLDLVNSKNGAPYSLSVIASIFNKYNFLKVLEKGWDPWEVEMKGSYNVSLKGSMRVIGTEGSVVPHCVGIRTHPEDKSGGKLWRECGFFKPEDRERMQELGILGETGYFE